MTRGGRTWDVGVASEPTEDAADEGGYAFGVLNARRFRNLRVQWH